MDGLGMLPLFPYPRPLFYRVGARGELMASYISDEGASPVVSPAGQWSFVRTGPWRPLPAAMLQAAEWMINGGGPAGGAQIVDPAALSSGIPLPQLNGGTGVFLPAPCPLPRPTVYQTPDFPPIAPEEDVRNGAVGKKLELNAATGKAMIKHDMPMKEGPSKLVLRQDHLEASAAREEKQPKPQHRKPETTGMKKPPAMAALQTEPMQKGKNKVEEEEEEEEEEEATATVVDDFPELALLPEEWTY